MNQDQLKTALASLQLDVPEWQRAALYLAFLQRNQHFLQDTIPQLLTADAHAFVAPALAQPGLLQAQLQTFDRWVGAAVSAEMTREIHAKAEQAHWRYAHYFEVMIFSTDEASFQQNVDAFFQRNPITLAAVQASASHFEQNLLRACQRLAQDREHIIAWLQQRHPGLILHTVLEITPSGSDFHKGGQQVLLLRLEASSLQQANRFELGLVYKPADLSADCLLLGDSTALKHSQTGAAGFMTASLIEIFNTLAARHPDCQVLPLPCYHILPRQVTDTPIEPAQFQACYGYIEFIPSDEADRVIEPNQDRAAIIQRFYREMGQWLALCSCFSILDLHLQNWRVHQWRAYPIDLEVSLIKPLIDFRDSELFGPFGGITGEEEKLSDWHWHINHRLLLMSQKFATTRYHNRLYLRQPDNSLRLVEVEQGALLQGFEAGLRLIARGQQAQAFDAWFARLQGVLVRYLPYPTHALEMIRRSIYIDCLHRPAPTNTLAPCVRTVLLHSLSARWRAEYAPAESAQTESRPTSLPHFVLLQETYCGSDFIQFDIPAFYHRIGSQDLLDARGSVVELPQQISLVSGETVELKFGRTSFFAEGPTSTLWQQQVHMLPEQLEARLQYLTKSIIAMLQAPA